MKTILKTHTMHQISDKCGVTYRTVQNWKAKETIPLWAIKQLEFELKRIK